MDFSEPFGVEAGSPRFAVEDMRIIEADLQDKIRYDPPKNSELASHIKGLIDVQEYHAENIKLHIKAIQELASASSRQTKILEKIEKRL